MEGGADDSSRKELSCQQVGSGKTDPPLKITASFAKDVAMNRRVYSTTLLNLVAFFCTSCTLVYPTFVRGYLPELWPLFVRRPSLQFLVGKIEKKVLSSHLGPPRVGGEYCPSLLTVVTHFPGHSVYGNNQWAYLVLEEFFTEWYLKLFHALFLFFVLWPAKVSYRLRCPLLIWKEHQNPETYKDEYIRKS